MPESSTTKYGVVVRLTNEVIHESYLPQSAICGIILDELGIPQDMRKYVDISVHDDYMRDSTVFKIKTIIPGVPGLFSIAEGQEYPLAGTPSLIRKLMSCGATSEERKQHRQATCSP